MNIDLTQLRDWLGLLAVIGGLLAGAVLWRLRGEFVTRKDFLDLAARLDRMESEMGQVRGQLQTTPTHKDLMALQARLGEVGGDVKALTRAVEGLGEQLQMLIEHHLKERACRP